MVLGRGVLGVGAGLWACLVSNVSCAADGTVGSYFSEPNPYANNSQTYTQQGGSHSGSQYGVGGYSDSSRHAADVAGVLRRRQMAQQATGVSAPKVAVDPEVKNVIVGFGEAVEAASGNPGVFTEQNMHTMIQTMAVEHPAFPAKIAEFVQTYGTPIMTAPASNGSPAALARDAMIKYAATTPGMHEPMMKFFEQHADVVMGPGEYHAAPARGLMPGIRSALGPAEILFAPLDKFQEAATSFGSTFASMNPFGSMAGMNPMSGGLLESLGAAVSPMTGGSSAPRETVSTAKPVASAPRPVATPPGMPSHQVKVPSPYLNMPFASQPPTNFAASPPASFYGSRNPPTAFDNRPPTAFTRPPTAFDTQPPTAFAKPPTAFYQQPGQFNAYANTVSQAAAPRFPSQNLGAQFGAPMTEYPAWNTNPMPNPTLMQKPYGFPENPRAPPTMIARPQFPNHGLEAPNTYFTAGAPKQPSYLSPQGWGKLAAKAPGAPSQVVANQPNYAYGAPTHGGAGAPANQPNYGVQGGSGAHANRPNYGGHAHGTASPQDLTTVPTIESSNAFEYDLSSGTESGNGLPSFANLFPFTKTISITKDLTVTPTAAAGAAGNFAREAQPTSAEAQAAAADSIGQGRLGLVTQLYEAGANQQRRLMEATSAGKAHAAETISQMAAAIGEKFGNAHVNRSLAQSLVHDYLEPLGMTGTMADYLEKNFPYLQAAPVNPSTPQGKQDPFHKIYSVFTNAFKNAPQAQY